MSDKLPHEMPHEVVSMGSERGGGTEGVDFKRSYITRPLQPTPYLCLAVFAPASITHPNINIQVALHCD